MTIDAEMMIGPEWARDFTMAYKWETKILRGLYGFEQRSTMYSFPRREMAYEVTFMSEAQAAYFTRVMMKNQGSVFAGVVWGEEGVLTAQASAAQLYVDITDVDKMNFEVGGYAALWNAYDDYELKEIDSLTSTRITFTSGLSSSWPLGSLIYPVVHSTVEQNIPYTKQTSAYGGAKLVFKEAWDSSVEHNLGSHSFPTFQGYPVFNKGPDWASGFGMSLNRPSDYLEKFGVQLRYTRQSESEMQLDARYLSMDLAECAELWGFFNACQGKWSQFWLPSWQRDVVVTSAVGSSDSYLTIQDIDYSAMWASNHIVGKFLYILLPDGSEIYRKIIGWPSATQLNLDSAMGVDVTADLVNLMLCSFLVPARMDIDELDLTYQIPGVAESRLRMQTIFDENMTTTTTTT